MGYKLDFGKYSGKPLASVPESYLEFLYKNYKRLVLEIERHLKIVPVERRSERVELSMMFDNFKKRYPDDAGLSEFYNAVLEKLYKF